MSEETEVKNIEWAKNQIELEVIGTTDREDPHFYVNVGLKMALGFLDQLDEQVFLTKEWIDKYSYNIEEYWEIADMMPEPQYAVSVENLQNVIVSNKKEIDQAYKDGYDKGIELMEVMNMVYEDGEFLENEKMKKCIEWLKEEEYSNRKDLEE